DENSASIVSKSLVETSLRGVDSHGIRLLPHYVKTLKGGRVNGQPQIKFSSLAMSTGTVDADNGFGQVAGFRAIDEAIKIADKCGIAAVTVINSSHFGAAGSYTLAAAERGFIGMAVCNSDKFVVAHDGVDPFHGTNPISFSVPIMGEKPYLFDMATSSIPWNRVLQYGLIDRELSSDVAIDANGSMTTHADEAQALLPLGGAEFGYKGAGLAGMCDVLSAVLSGMKFSHQLYSFTGPDFSKHRQLGQFYIVMKPEAFIPADIFDQQMKAYLHDLRNQKSKPGTRVLAPGDREWSVEAQRSNKGIPMDPAVWDIFCDLAKSLGVQSLTPVVD
ncbi:MAG: Ldh family oxidoreductase, partial [Gammaproteobacteria bacterium]|nr:Ldh family oxidoreductase [Gammaproteobacteria bacterium]